MHSTFPSTKRRQSTLHLTSRRTLLKIKHYLETRRQVTAASAADETWTFHLKEVLRMLLSLLNTPLPHSQVDVFEKNLQDLLEAEVKSGFGRVIRVDHNCYRLVPHLLDCHNNNKSTNSSSSCSSSTSSSRFTNMDASSCQHKPAPIQPKLAHHHSFTMAPLSTTASAAICDATAVVNINNNVLRSGGGGSALSVGGLSHSSSSTASTQDVRPTTMNALIQKITRKSPSSPLPPPKIAPTPTSFVPILCKQSPTTVTAPHNTTITTNTTTNGGLLQDCLNLGANTATVTTTGPVNGGVGATTGGGGMMMMMMMSMPSMSNLPNCINVLNSQQGLLLLHNGLSGTSYGLSNANAFFKVPEEVVSRNASTVDSLPSGSFQLPPAPPPPLPPHPSLLFPSDDVLGQQQEQPQQNLNGTIIRNVITSTGAKNKSQDENAIEPKRIKLEATIASSVEALTVETGGGGGGVGTTTTVVSNIIIPPSPLHSQSRIDLGVCYICRFSLLEGAFLQCHDCHKAAHPSCLGFWLELTERIRLMDGWQCFDCKSCCVCRNKLKKGSIYTCYGCDRGFHTQCHNPPLKSNKNSPAWTCCDCQIEGCLIAETNNNFHDVTTRKQPLCGSDLNSAPFVNCCSKEEFHRNNAFQENVTSCELTLAMKHWTVEDVAQWLKTIGFYQDSEKFRSCEIDGVALLLLTRETLISEMAIPLGRAVKIYEKVRLMRTTSFGNEY